jgi:hypothetical protein
MLRIGHRAINLSAVPLEHLAAELARRGRALEPLPAPGQVAVTDSELSRLLGDVSLGMSALGDALALLERTLEVNRGLWDRLAAAEPLFVSYVANGVGDLSRYLEEGE